MGRIGWDNVLGEEAMQQPKKEPETASDVDLHDLVQRGYRLAFSLTHDEAAAEDLVQDAWLATLRAGGPRTAAYVLTAIRNRFIDQWRRSQLVTFQPLGDEESVFIGSERDLWADPHEVGIRSRVLSNALDRLNPEERSALYLSAAEGYTAQEIACLFGKPRGTVLSMLFRTKKKLRDLLQLNGEEKW